MLQNLRFRLYHVLEPGEDDGLLGRRVDALIMASIVVSVLVVMLETVRSVASAYGHWLAAIEAVTVALFTVEYVARVWTAPVNHHYRRPVRGRLRYMLTPMAMVDLAAILPFFVAMLVSVDDLHTLLMLRMFRLMRVFKLARYIESLRLVTDVFRAKRHELTIVLTIELFLLVTFSSVMYLAEHRAQPEMFSSIPASMWFGIVTMTTVGYGDVSPVTTLGKFAAASLALVGVAMFALPTGIIAAGFGQQLQKRQRTFTPTCPHCGKDPFVPPDDVLAERAAKVCGAGDAFHEIADGVSA